MSDEQYTLPSAIEQEADVLGTCLAEGTSWWRRVEHLMDGASDVSELFYEQNHYLVAGAIKRVVEENGALSIASVTDMLLNAPDGSSDRLAPDVGTYLTHLQARGALRNLSELSSSVDVLNQKLQLRNQLRGIEEIQRVIKRDQPHPNEISAELRQISLNASVSQETPTFGEIIDAMELRDGLGVAHRMSTGIEDMDALFRGGLEPGRLCIVGARPKVGKTTFMFNLALQALAQDYVVVFASLEIGERELWSKLLSAQSMVNQSKIQQMLDNKITINDFSVEEQERIEEAKAGLKSADLHTMFAGNLQHGVDSIISSTMRVMQRHPDRPIIIFVDYLQLLSDDPYNKAAAIGVISRKLKLFCIEMDVIAVVASQINRAGAEDGMPSPHQLKESGSIEQDADIVMILNRPSLQDQTQPEHIMDIWVALNRYGASGWVKAYYMPEIQTITDMKLIWDGDDAEEEDDRRRSSSVEETSKIKSGYLNEEEDYEVRRPRRDKASKRRKINDDNEDLVFTSTRARRDFGFPSGADDDDM